MMVLCDDGTLWYRRFYDTEWKELEAPPPRKKVEGD